jgi:oligoendopeptidase F
LAKWAFYESKVDDIEGIYDKMVHLRADMATELGYNNFITMGYYRMLRSDYDAAAVKKFRDKVHECIVPIVQKLLKRQAKRIGVDNMRFFDEPILFKNGNPKPIGTTEEVVAKARKMYDELSPETGLFSALWKKEICWI